MSIGKRIKELRLQRNLTLEYVGGIIGSSKQNLYKYENEIITNIPSDKIEKLAMLYEVSPCYIMGWEVPPKNQLTLTDQEQEFLTDFRKLNPVGKEKATDYVHDLTENSKYTSIDEKENASA